MQAAKNIGASAKAGMDKTKAVVQEKVEKITANHPVEKEEAEIRKQEKIQEAEMRKQEAMQQNAASGGRTGHAGGPIDVTTAHNYTTTATAGHTAGGHVTPGVVGAHPIGRETGTGRTSAAHNPLAGSTDPALRGTGGGYN